MRLNLFASKRKITKVPKLNMTYKNMQIKQHSKITYLCCILDRTMSGKSMVLKVINKINLILKFLHRKKNLLSECSYSTSYASSIWYPNLTKKMKNKI